jgi:hypothetical protein
MDEAEFVLAAQTIHSPGDDVLEKCWGTVEIMKNLPI